jgi:hypothetical protein
MEMKEFYKNFTAIISEYRGELLRGDVRLAWSCVGYSV